MGTRHGVIDCARSEADYLLSGACVGLFNPGMNDYYPGTFAVLGQTDEEKIESTEVWRLDRVYDEEARDFVYQSEKVAVLPGGQTRAAAMIDFEILYVVTTGCLYTVDRLTEATPFSNFPRVGNTSDSIPWCCEEIRSILGPGTAFWSMISTKPEGGGIRLEIDRRLLDHMKRSIPCVHLSIPAVRSTPRTLPSTPKPTT